MANRSREGCKGELMVRLSMERLQQSRRPARSGDKCQCDQCTGRLKVYSTRIIQSQDIRVQYLECRMCGWKPDNTVRIPLEFAPPRK